MAVFFFREFQANTVQLQFVFCAERGVLGRRKLVIVKIREEIKKIVSGRGPEICIVKKKKVVPK